MRYTVIKLNGISGLSLFLSMVAIAIFSFLLHPASTSSLMPLLSDYYKIHQQLIPVSAHWHSEQQEAGTTLRCMCIKWNWHKLEIMKRFLLLFSGREIMKRLGTRKMQSTSAVKVLRGSLFFLDFLLNPWRRAGLVFPIAALASLTVLLASLVVASNR